MPDNEPPPNFRSSSSSARDEAFRWMMFGSVVAAATFVTVPVASAASFAVGVAAAAVAYATHNLRRTKRSERPR